MIFGWPYRWPPTLAVPAILCFARTSLRKSDFVSEAFSCFADHFRARRRGEIYALDTKHPRNFHNPEIGYPPPRASVGRQSEITVNNAVDKLIHHLFNPMIRYAPMELSDPIRQALLAAAAKVVVARLNGQNTPTDSDLPNDPALLQPAGCFVSLHSSATHQLRGCIGILENPKPLREIVAQAAEGVLKDYRFAKQPVTASEINELDLEVTVLGPLMPAQSPLHFDPQIHGIYLTVLGHSGLFLPQVARETGWTKEQLLTRLSFEKLGLAPESWKHPSATLRTFTADVIGPKPLRECLPPPI
jgi:AmmeMemoRadiSam system protein A